MLFPISYTNVTYKVVSCKSVSWYILSRLDLSTLREMSRFFRDELNKAGREGYSKDYENLIRKYFEALQGRRREIKFSSLFPAA